MSEALNRAQKALNDARSTGQKSAGGMMPMFEPEPMDSPLDEETMDEQASTQMGGWVDRRRPTYEGD
jgi:hypothetical protein